MRDRQKIERLKDLANRESARVLAALGVNARPKGSGYILLSDPTRKDENPSLAIWVKGGFVTFKNFASSGQGDIVDLVSYLKGWWDLPHRGFAEAARWLEDLLGLARVPTARLAEDARKAKLKAAHERKVAAEAEAQARRRAFSLWLSGTPIAGTLGETYLHSRALDLSALPRQPQILRFLPSHKHRFEDPKSPRHGEISYWPCLAAGCVDRAMKIQAVHRTWIARDGSGKAPVTPSRKCWPGYAGLVIPLWRGDSGLSVREAAACGLRETLVLTEGIEDGLSAVLAAPAFRTWAAIALDNFQNVPLPECVDSVIIHRQNDWLKLGAVEKFDRARRALEAQGRPVAEVEASMGKDLNDTLRGAA